MRKKDIGAGKRPLLGKLIGDGAFYRKVLAVTIPIIIQSGIRQFVNMLDNIMVGQIGTDQMSGVAIVNEMMLVFNITMFGAAAGAGILGAQYCGKKDWEGVRYTFRFKVLSCLLLCALAMAVFGGFGDRLLRLYLHEGSAVGDIEATYQYGRQYLSIIMASMIPFALTEAYAGTLKEKGNTVVPMTAGIIAVTVNMVFNYIFIFGKFGMPKMGVRGAAMATVLSRIAELSIVLVWTHIRAMENPFIIGAYRNFRIPWPLIARISKVGIPLLINEAMYSGGLATLAQNYSMRGLAAVAAVNITNTISNVFSVVFMSLGSTVGIIVGQLLGAGQLEQAKDEDNKLLAIAVAGGILMGLVLFVIAPMFPKIYNTDSEVQELATCLIRVMALCMPIHSFANAAYFTMRCGGRTVITFLFDSLFVWVVMIPLVYNLTRFTNLPILLVYAAGQSVEVIKCVIGFILVKKGVWIQNITNEKHQ